MRILKYKNIFAKGIEGIVVIKGIRNTVLWTYAVNDLNGEKIIETFYEKEWQKIYQ